MTAERVRCADYEIGTLFSLPELKSEYRRYSIWRLAELKVRMGEIVGVVLENAHDQRDYINGGLATDGFLSGVPAGKRREGR